MWAIVVAAGSGARYGGAKQFADLDGMAVVERSVRAARSVSDGVVVVLPAADVADLADGAPPFGADACVPGGATRSGSVRAGLRAVPSGAGVVIVHDGARPLAPIGLFASVVRAVRGGADAAVPVVPVTDTIRRQGGGVVERSDLLAVQTPQAFPADVLRRAHAGGAEATDDVALVEAAGGKVVTVDGDPRNLKITDPHDLVVAAALLTP